MSTAQQLYDEAFSKPHAMRSCEYRDGVMEALKFRCGEIGKIQIPGTYGMGSAQADAWFAGVEHGHTIWRDCYDFSKVGHPT